MNGGIVELRDGMVFYAFADVPGGQSGIYACSTGNGGIKPGWFYEL